ncbi:hypothetical protein F4212_09165, partial [Candidatus Poribacteria bacterium]|nr:hypothetical protein [Candidatus Poribacteria bacterium]
MSNQNTNQIYQSIINKLNRVRITWRWLILSEHLLKWIAVLSIVMTVVLLCFQLALPLIFRGTIVVLLLGIALYFTIRFLIRPLFRKFTYTSVAAYLEKAYPNIENRILSAVQLKHTLENNRLGYAQEFVVQLINQTQDDIDKIELKKIFQREYQKIRKSAGFAVIAVCALMLTNFLLPSALEGFTQTFETLPKTTLEGFSAQITEVSPGNVQIKRGEDVTIKAKVSGHLDASVYVYYRLAQTDEKNTQVSHELDDNLERNENLLPHTQESETWQSLLMNREPTDIPYTATIENIDRSLQYYVSTKDIVSERFQIAVSHEPIVESFQLQLNYPTYTQLPPQILETSTGNADVLYGTEVNITGKSNKPLKESHLIFDESDPVPLQIDAETGIKGSFVAKEAGTYHIQILDKEGLTNTTPLVYTLNVFKDNVPQVEIVEPGKDLELDDDMLVKLKVEATDDYGLQTLQLVHRIQKENADDVIVTLKQIPLSTSPPQTSQFITYTWDIDPIGLFPGEILSYYVQALDTDDVSGPNIGKSRTYTLRFPTLDELYEELASEQETEQYSLDELFDEQSEATGMVEELLDKIRKFNEFSLTDKKRLQQVVETQKQIEKKANELITNMQQTTTDIEKNQLFEPETIQKYQELQELMKEALSEEHQELLKKLSEALAQQQISEQEQAMTEANFNQELFQQQLERMKSLYQQMIMQQKLEAAAKQAQSLAEQQKELMDSIDTTSTKNTDAPTTSEGVESADAQQSSNPEQEQTKSSTLEKAELNDSAQKEDRIKEESDKLSDKLDSLGNEMSEMAKSQENTAPQIQKIADEVKRLNQFAQDQNLSENLQRTSESLRNEQQQKALQTGREAEQTMTELAQGLDNALEFMEGANSNQALVAMREAVKSSLYFSHLHEKTINQTSDLVTSNTMDYIPSEIQRLQKLASDELSVANGISQLANKLWELGKQQMQIDPEIVWQLNSSSDALNRAARALEDRQTNLALPIQKQGLAELNQAISDMLDAMAQMNQQMGAGGLEDMLQQLQQLAQSQEQLNQMAQNLSQQMREQGRTPGLQQRLDRLAAQQQLIREATERLAELAEEAAEMLGSLKNVAEEMADVERKLEQGTLNDQVIEQQERIVTRMLDSLKSLQKRDVGRQRKAQVANRPTAPPQDIPPLHPELLEIVRKFETTPNAKELENIPFQYRELLKQYFKALS